MRTPPVRTCSGHEGAPPFGPAPGQGAPPPFGPARGMRTPRRTEGYGGASGAFGDGPEVPGGGGRWRVAPLPAGGGPRGRDRIARSDLLFSWSHRLPCG